jgi:hypothetical protein
VVIFRVSGMLALVCSTLLIAGCDVLFYKPVVDPPQTEADWINGQFGDPEKPRIISSEETFESIDYVSPSYLVVKNFAPKSGPRLFQSGLFISVMGPPKPFPSFPSGSLDEVRLSQYGKMIGKNSCGQTLFRVTQHTEFARDVYARAQALDNGGLLVLIVPDSETLIACFTPNGTIGCSVHYRRKKVDAYIVVPSENVCSWPTIRQQLQEAIDGGLVPQTIRDPKLGNIKNAK